MKKNLNASVKLFITGVGFTLLPPLIVKTFGATMHGKLGTLIFLVVFAPTFFLSGGLKALKEKESGNTVSPRLSGFLNWGGVLVFVAFIAVGILSHYR